VARINLRAVHAGLAADSASRQVPSLTVARLRQTLQRDSQKKKKKNKRTVRQASAAAAAAAAAAAVAVAEGTCTASTFSLVRAAMAFSCWIGQNATSSHPLELDPDHHRISTRSQGCCSNLVTLEGGGDDGEQYGPKCLRQATLRHHQTRRAPSARHRLGR